jgi:EAL domain-containing protein (putative c-di-GMP-specific phosphodiesterase class I)
VVITILAVGHDSAIIVQTIIAMASNLGMDDIAEGVETEEQRDFLNEHHCLNFQGHLFGKPVPVDQFEQILKHDTILI